MQVECCDTGELVQHVTRGSELFINRFLRLLCWNFEWCCPSGTVCLSEEGVLFVWGCGAAVHEAFHAPAKAL